MKPWYETWFDSPYYHILYHHRDGSEAAAFLDSDQVRTAFLEAFNSAWKNRKRLGREIDDET